MQTWKKIVIASSITLIVGVGVYYILQISKFKKIKDRGFIINVRKDNIDSTKVPTYPDDGSGSYFEEIPITLN